MSSLRGALLALAVFGIASGIPMEQKSLPAFRVEVASKTNSRPLNGPAEYLKALKKYGATENLDEVSKAAALVAATPVPATPANGDSEYITPVTIGSQTFQLDFDTGSSDLWVLDSSMDRNIGPNHTYYKPGSTGKLMSGATWNITYADKSGANGVVYSDTVTIGGVTVTNQAVEAAKTASVSMDGYNTSPDDGLLGLGFDNINQVKPTKAKTFFSNAIEQGLPKALFTVSLKKGKPGYYTFGELDSSQYKGQITYSDVNSTRGYWMFTPSGYSIGGKAGTSNASPIGIVDTGTTLLLVNNTIATEYWKQVPSSSFAGLFGGYTFTCSEKLPDFTLNINGYSATVPGSYINYSPVIVGGDVCFGGLQPVGNSIPFSVYGDVFLKSQFVVFDRSQSTPRMGFANQS